MTDLLLRYEDAVAAECSAIAEALGAPVHKIADGTAVLMGPGFYVNQIIGLGLRKAVSVHDLIEFERLSAEAGVPAEIETSHFSDPSLLVEVKRRGYELDSTVAALAIDLSGQPRDETDGHSPFEIRAVSGTDLDLWKDAASTGFGYTSDDQRRVSDVFIDALDSVPDVELLVAVEEGRVVAAASLSVRDGVANIGGMSTDPAARGRGAQQAMIRHRLAVARARGCDLAITSANAGSGSERNLRRAGFSLLTNHEHFVRPLADIRSERDSGQTNQGE